MPTDHDLKEMQEFARFMRAFNLATPLVQEIKTDLEAEGKDPAGPEFQKRLERRLNRVDFRALIDYP